MRLVDRVSGLIKPINVNSPRSFKGELVNVTASRRPSNLVAELLSSNSKRVSAEPGPEAVRVGVLL